MMRSGNFVKGMLTGALVGAGIVTLINPMDKRSVRQMKRRANRVAKTVEGVADNVSHWMK